MRAPFPFVLNVCLSYWAERFPNDLQGAEAFGRASEGSCMKSGLEERLLEFFVFSGLKNSLIELDRKRLRRSK